MISYSQFKKSYSKKYVALNIDEESSVLLRTYAQGYGFDLSSTYGGDSIDPNDFEFHTTIFYTTTYHDTPVETRTIPAVKLIPSHIELLGENRDIPVIRLKLTDELLKIRNYFESLGYKDAWSEYKPHISLSYVRKPYDISGIKLPDFEITASTLTIKNQVM